VVFEGERDVVRDSPHKAPRALRLKGFIGQRERLNVVTRVAGVLTGALLWAIVANAPVQAATGHRFLQSVSEASQGTLLVEPGPAAVEQASGRVLLADPGRGVIDVFSSAGSFEDQFGGGGLAPVGVAVDQRTQFVYVADSFQNAVEAFKPDGEGGYALAAEWAGRHAPGERFGEVSGVGVDNSASLSDPHAGDVFVVDALGGVVDIFKPNPEGPEEAREGSFLGTLTGHKLEEPNAVAVDSATGKVFVADSVKGFVAVYGSSGAYEKKLTGSGQPDGTFLGPKEEGGNVTALAVDEASGELYVSEAERGVVSQFGGEGQWLGWITNTPEGSLSEPRGVAVASGGDVYVGDALAGRLDLFGPDVVVPDVATGGASQLSKTSAVLGGVVNGDGTVVTYRYQWGETEALGEETESHGAGTTEKAVPTELTGLNAGTRYFFRLIAENENGVTFGNIRKFETKPAVERLATGPVQNVQPTGVTLTGTLNPRGTDVHYFFQWGKTVGYGNASPQPPADAGEEKELVDVTTALSGLSPNTTYHYRLVGEDVFGLTDGEDEQFTTSGAPRIVIEAASVEGHESATLKTRIDPSQLETKYHFEYGETTSYGTEVPVGGAKIPAGETFVGESAAVSGLKVGTTYHFRVVASNSAGRTVGPDQTFTTIPPALIESEFSSAVFGSEATLNTQVNPLGHDTTYFFEYGTESCRANPTGCTSVPVVPVDVGSGEAGVLESVRIEGLEAASTYHYRVVASNVLGMAEGEERTFTTQALEQPLALPDDRAFELVSPPDKHGAPVEALTREGGLILAAEDGNSITYVADGSIVEEPEGNRAPEMQQVLSVRTPEGWSTRDLATRQEKAEGLGPGAAPEYQFFTPELSEALVEPWATTRYAEPPLAPGATQATMYVRDNATGTYLPLVTEANVPSGTAFGNLVHFVDATPDLTHVVLRSTVALARAPAGPGLYEWSGGHLHFVSQTPSGTAASEAVLGYSHAQAHAISTDGSRVFWTASAESPAHLYMRDTVSNRTIQLDAAQGVREPSIASARFQGASSDGSIVFFTDKQQLTPNSTAEPAQGVGKPDLYACEIVDESGSPACKLSDLTVEEDPGEHASVQGLLLGSGEDGSTVYFIARGVLAGNENGSGELAVSGQDNLYELHHGATGWITTFVVTLAGEDQPEWNGGEHANLSYLTARVSPSGRYLAFMSVASLTGYDNLDLNSGKPDEEVYLYDSSAHSLRCVSCNPTGARPLGVFDTNEAGEGLGLVVDRRRVWSGHWLAGSIPGWTAESLVNALFQPRYLSDSGRLFFDSSDALMPGIVTRTRTEQVNGREIEVGVENVYEYEPSGVGGCTSPTGGCVSVISSGASGNESAFLEATPTGNDVFFLTASHLLPQDPDTAFDVYDARVCSSVAPCLSAPSPPGASCSSIDTCREAAPAQQAPIGPAGTAAFSGPGNSIAAPTVATLGTKTGRQAKLSRAQRLTRALKACKRLKPTKRRARCAAHARKRYRPKKALSKRGNPRRQNTRANGRRKR
jgi:DNA-binding beta-propeller fold protein YncE